MWVQKSFFEWGKSCNWLKSIFDLAPTNFNCKAVEVTEVIEKVNSRKSGRKNHRWRRRIKKHSRTSLELQFNEMNEKLRSTLCDQQINWTMPTIMNKIISKNEKLKQSNQVNKKIIITKTLEAFTPKAKFDLFKFNYFKSLFNTKLWLWNRSSILSGKPEKNSLALEDRLARK